MIVGIDFGTTNSLIAVADGVAVYSYTQIGTSRPHPSVVWYRGDDIVVGHKAREHLDLSDAAAPLGLVRSPKMSLRRTGALRLDGRTLQPSEVIAEVFRHLKQDANQNRDTHVERAVLTIPVDFGGAERRALRRASELAGIRVVQFVHEPVAALYAFLRSQQDFVRQIGRLEGRSVLVFDWGGGTLDLTLCRISGGTIHQIANFGDNEVGGDRFDERLRNLLRERHATKYGLSDVTAIEQPGMAAKLLHQCELMKIGLSSSDKSSVSAIVRNYLKTDDASKNLVESVDRTQLEKCSEDIVRRGLGRIDSLLDRAQLTYRDVEFCLSTGGMVNMPAIQRGLVERFPGRVPKIDNGDRIIAEGAAWIAHDGTFVELSKDLEILVANGAAEGSYYPIVPAGQKLPLENDVLKVANSRLYCVDPREGTALIEFAKPARLGGVEPAEPRIPLGVLRVEVDPKAEPLMERLECDVTIDHDYIVNISLRSSARNDEATLEIHDLEFSLSLLQTTEVNESGPGKDPERASRPLIPIKGRSNTLQRSNVVIPSGPRAADVETLWGDVPGDIVDVWRPYYFDRRTTIATPVQQREREFYLPCHRCNRLISQIKAEGPIDVCRGHRCERA